MADGSRPRRGELLPGFVGKPGHGRVVDLLRQFEAFVAPEGGDIRRLALQVDRIFRIGLELGGDRRRQLQELRPDAGDVRDAGLGIGQEVEGGAPLAVLVEEKP